MKSSPFISFGTSVFISVRTRVCWTIVLLCGAVMGQLMAPNRDNLSNVDETIRIQDGDQTIEFTGKPIKRFEFDHYYNDKVLKPQFVSEWVNSNDSVVTNQISNGNGLLDKVLLYLALCLILVYCVGCCIVDKSAWLTNKVNNIPTVEYSNKKIKKSKSSRKVKGKSSLTSASRQSSQSTSQTSQSKLSTKKSSSLTEKSSKLASKSSSRSI